MIPIRDENPTYTTPYVVYALLVLNILVFLLGWLGSIAVSLGAPVGGLKEYAMIPARVVADNPNLPIALRNYFIPPSPSPVWITIFTSMFMHAGLVHLGGNMLFLWIFGNNIEDVLGHFKFLAFYLAGGVAAALAHIASNPHSRIPTVGASGAIAAVLGAYIVLFPRSRIDTLIFFIFITVVRLPAVVILGYWIVFQVLSATMGQGMTPDSGGVAYWAHIGGFAAGVAGILILGGQGLIRRRRRPSRRIWYGH